MSRRTCPPRSRYRSPLANPGPSCRVRRRKPTVPLSIPHMYGTLMQTIGGGAAARPDADGGTACLANIARTGAPHGAAPPHSVTIQECSNMYKS
jgi:hypothetical protein